MLDEVLFTIFISETRATKIETMSRIGAIIEKCIEICNKCIMLLKLEEVDFSAEVFG